MIERNKLYQHSILYEFYVNQNSSSEIEYFILIDESIKLTTSEFAIFEL